MNVRAFAASLLWALGLAALGVGGAGAQDELPGLYRFVVDQPANFSPKADAEVLLDIDGKGGLHLTATQPGQVLSTEGTYKLNGARIAIEFPELGKSVKDGPWSLQGETLKLPFQLMADEEGTSEWKREPGGDTPIDVFYAVVNRKREEGTPPEEAARAAAEEAKKRSEEWGQTDAEVITTYEVWPDGVACKFTFRNGHPEMVLVGTRIGEMPQPRVLQVGLWASDPRTHIPAKPHTAPDDPKNKTALLFAPFDNAPYWSYGKGGIGKVASFKEGGEDVDLIKRKLETAHYEVKVLRDAEATPRALHDEIMRLQPGVLWMSSHSCASDDSVSIATGAYLGSTADAKEIMNGSDRIRKIVEAAVPPGCDTYLDFGTAVQVAGAETEIVIPFWHQRNHGAMVATLSVTDRFFRDLVREGADFSTSLIYAASCCSAENDVLVRACKARQFLGYNGLITIPGCATETKYVFTILTKPTWSVREVVGLANLVIDRGQVVFFPEDDWLAAVPEEDFPKLQLYGMDFQPLDLPDVNAIWLCYMARWSAEHPEAGCEALQKAYDDFWSKGSFSRLASPFATAGVRGNHTPTQEEVVLARHLVSGEPTMPCGRFTLNDTDPTRLKEPEE